MPRSILSSCLLLTFCLPTTLMGQESDLADHFGFGGLEVIKIGRDAGPIYISDVNNDGLKDLIAINNRASRIDLLTQKENASPSSEQANPKHANELPEHWRFNREQISVMHKVMAIAIHDFDNDGLSDLIYAGSPDEIVFLKQTSLGNFETSRRHRVKNLTANRSGFAVANLIGDSAPELVSLVEGDIWIWPMDGDQLGQETVLSSGEGIAAFRLSDFTGDGQTDVAGIIPESSAPVRLWLGSTEQGMKTIGSQIPFEMPALREFISVTLPDDPAARMAVIEKASKRIVLYKVSKEAVAETGDREASLRVQSFTDPSNRGRQQTVIDTDGDGLLDLVATDTEANALAIYRQTPGKGMQAGVLHPGLSDVKSVVAGNVDDDPQAEIFVLSEKEGVVGRSDVTADGKIPFPRPLNLSDGHTPLALSLVELNDGMSVAVIGKSTRDYMIDLIDMDGQRRSFELGKLTKSPEAILAIDADQDGKTDLLLMTPDRPMIMMHATDDGFEMVESDSMGQYGLVKAAGSDNTAVKDIDFDGKAELLIADKNFVRGVRYEPNPGNGISPGWQVIEQINAHDSTADLVAIDLLPDGNLLVADKENDRLLIMNSENDTTGPWSEKEAISVRNFDFGPIYSGSFAGSGDADVLAIGKSGFAVIRLSGDRYSLKEANTWRTDEERRMQHELSVGDVNADGYTDMVSLDSGEQMLEIFTFTKNGDLKYVTGFQVFESKLFSGGAGREYEPSQVIITDMTNDGAHDIILLSHDRILMYPQMTEKKSG